MMMNSAKIEENKKKIIMVRIRGQITPCICSVCYVNDFESSVPGKIREYSTRAKPILIIYLILFIYFFLHSYYNNALQYDTDFLSCVLNACPVSHVF